MLGTDDRPPTTPAPHPALGPATSFALVLEPTAADVVWTALVAEASATVQSRGFARVIDDAGARAALELALATAAIDVVVVGGEGVGRPFGRSSLALRTRAVAALIRSLPVARCRLPRICALWCDVEARQLYAYALDDVEGTFAPVSLAAALPAHALAIATASVAVPS